MLSGIKQQGIVGKNGKIEIETPELAEGTIVEIIVLTEKVGPQDTTEYLLSTQANRRHLLDAIQSVENRENLVSFTVEEWNEEYNVHT